MNLKTVTYNFSEINVKKSQEQKDFKEKIKVSNIIYLFYKDNKCLYIGETGNSLKDRCYTHTPKHSKQDWFKKANRIHIIELDEGIKDRARKRLKSAFILAYKPKHNKRA